MGQIIPSLLQVTGRGQTSYSWKFNYTPPGTALFARRMYITLTFSPAAAAISVLKMGGTNAGLLYTVTSAKTTLLVYDLNALTNTLCADPNTITLTFDRPADVFLRVHSVLDDVPSTELLTGAVL